MFKDKFDHNNPRSFNRRFREKRFAFFKSLIETLPRPIHILDIGGTEAYWKTMDFADEEDIYFTLCNLDKQEVTRKNFRFMQADATNLPMIPDKTFDIVFSNSVIEHLFTRENQAKMAKEIRRIGKYYFVQTPNIHFPLEAHWRFPFFQYMPVPLRVFMTRHFDLGRFPKARDKAFAQQRVDEIKLLSEKQMKKLFPDGQCYREKFLGMTKSVTMFKFSETA